MTAPRDVPGPGGLDYLAHLARDSARFVEVLTHTRSGARVLTCPDWDADDLLWHLARVQWFWGTIAGRGLTTLEDVEILDRSGRPSRPEDRNGLLAFFGSWRAPAEIALMLTYALYLGFAFFLASVRIRSKGFDGGNIFGLCMWLLQVGFMFYFAIAAGIAVKVRPF